MTCVGNQSVDTDKGMDTAMVEWNSLIASDNSGNVSVTCDPKSETNFTIGQTTIACEAIDESGNRATCSFQVNVTGKCPCTVYFMTKFLCLSAICK